MDCERSPRLCGARSGSPQLQVVLLDQDGKKIIASDVATTGILCSESEPNCGL